METFRGQRNIWKGSPVFGRNIPKGNSFSISSKPSLTLVSVRGRFLVNGTYFLPMINAILGRNLPVLNFTYHLPKLWTDCFAHIMVSNRYLNQDWTEKGIQSSPASNRHPLNMDSPLVRTLSMAPLVSILVGFHCILFMNFKYLISSQN